MHKHQLKKIGRSVFSIPLLSALLLSGCGMPFMQMKELRTLREPSLKRTSVVYYRKNFRYTSDGRLTATDHLLVQVGENRRSLPGVIGAFSGTGSKLTDFAARVVNLDGGAQTLDRGDLYSVNLSGEALTQDEMMTFPLSGSVEPGDLIEEYMKHDLTMPELGVNFSLDDVGRSSNVECSVDVPNDMRFRYIVVNDSAKPDILVRKRGRKYVFRWPRYAPGPQEPLLGPQNSAPGFLGYVTDTLDRGDTAHPWRSFGNWYLKLVSNRIAFNKGIAALADKITKGLTSPRQKMDALFNYCQKNIRYEEVYLKNGEFIPDSASLVLRRDYGDCKDYSTALYALGRSIGLHPCLALCYRGRGEVFYPKVPVNQFNHMLVYFRYKGKTYWYDGTDTQGIPGLTSDDLINQEALVLEKGNSRIVNMGEDRQDELSIDGTLSADGSAFSGKLSIYLSDQYAVDFFYVQSQLDNADTRTYLVDWVNENLNPKAIVRSSRWEVGPRKFVLDLEVEFPDCSARVGNSIYTSLKSLFPELFPSDMNADTVSDIYYFPFYDRVAVRLHLDAAGGSSTDTSAAGTDNLNLNYSYRINPGPISESDRQTFLKEFAGIAGTFRKPIVLNAKGGS